MVTHPPELRPVVPPNRACQRCGTRVLKTRQSTLFWLTVRLCEPCTAAMVDQLRMLLADKLR